MNTFMTVLDMLCFMLKHILNTKTLYLHLHSNSKPWYPVVPISMYLLGSNDVVTLDITPLTDKDKLVTTIKIT